MTTKYCTKAFILQKNDKDESDRIFSIFSNDFGRLDIFAKAIRKSKSKLRGGIDIFYLSAIEFVQGKNRKTLTDASVIKKFDKILSNVEKFRVANAIGEILENFIKGEEKDSAIFDLINDVIEELNGKNFDNKIDLLYYYFLWNTLSILGYHPNVKDCVACHKKLNPHKIYFSESLGGALCEKCLTHCNNSLEVNSDIIKMIRLMFKKEWRIVSKLKIEATSEKLFKKISDNYYLYILTMHSSKK